jgi:hypothetical protein
MEMNYKKTINNNGFPVLMYDIKYKDRNFYFLTVDNKIGIINLLDNIGNLEKKEWKISSEKLIDVLDLCLN